jgi:tetratricopeptide (TPR) repeat protein
MKNMIRMLFCLMLAAPLASTAGLKEKIQEEIDSNPFLKERGIKIVAKKEENGYVTLEMVTGNHEVRKALIEGMDIQNISSVEMGLLSWGKSERETISTLKRVIGRIEKIPGVKEVVLKALASTPSNPAQEMAAQRQRDLIVNFAQRRQQQMLAAAKAQQREVPVLFKEFFFAATSYDWPATSNLVRQIQYHSGRYEGPHGSIDPALNTELWHYMLETFGAFETVTLWNPVMLQRYEEEILRPLSKNCIYFGGTDPGRFVPTVLRETSPIPFYVITQNGLADGPYMTFLRTRCDASVLLPTPEECNAAFKQFAEDVRTGRTQPGADVRVENGRVSVEGVQGVIAINGILAKWIFDKNKDKHSFYVEESYVIPWMYPYLKPFGVIMKIEKEPLPTPQQDAAYWQALISKDFAYWDQLLGEFIKRPEFKRDISAPKAFSKMRCAIAGVYEFRGVVNAAELAYQQAIAICPESAEASFRLANLYMRLNRVDKAVEILAKLAELDPSNKQVCEALEQFKAVQRKNAQQPADKSAGSSK